MAETEFAVIDRYDQRIQHEVDEDIYAIRHARSLEGVASIVRAMKALGRYTREAHEANLASVRRLHSKGVYR